MWPTVTVLFIRLTWENGFTSLSPEVLVFWGRQQESVDEREDAYCSAFLGEDFLPVSQQNIHGFKQVHGGLVGKEWDSGI